MATTRAQSVAQVQQSSGGPVPPQAAGKNGVINAAMNNWQRGTSFTATGYTADRWYFYNGVAGRTVSRQTSGLTGFQYCMRVQRDSGNTNTSVGAVNVIKSASFVTGSYYFFMGNNNTAAYLGWSAEL